VVKTDHQVRSYGPIVTAEQHPPVPQYEIRVAGHLAPRWSTWFDGLSVVTEAEGTTVIRGPVVDQAALHGLLQKLRDVGIPLISLTPIPSNAPEPPAHPSPKEN
jgi:hypothetical protein